MVDLSPTLSLDPCPGTNSPILASAKTPTHKLHLIGTKTDVERKGADLLFFRNNSKCCPFTAMRAYAARPFGSSSSPLFVNGMGNKISQAWVVKRLRNKLTQIGMEATFLRHLFEEGRSSDIVAFESK